MKAIVAVYHTQDSDDWGIGANGTQPIVLSADRKFFRKTTTGCPVIVGYTTLLDFPNQAPLPHRKNFVLTRKNIIIPGADVVNDITSLQFDELQNAFVIGGASVYKQLLPYCDEVYVTHVYTDIAPDVFFPKLVNNSEWQSVTLETGEENGIEYKIEKFFKKE